MPHPRSEVPVPGECADHRDRFPALPPHRLQRGLHPPPAGGGSRRGAPPTCTARQPSAQARWCGPLHRRRGSSRPGLLAVPSSLEPGTWSLAGVVRGAGSRPCGPSLLAPLIGSPAARRRGPLSCLAEESAPQPHNLDLDQLWKFWFSLGSLPAPHLKSLFSLKVMHDRKCHHNRTGSATKPLLFLTPIFLSLPGGRQGCRLLPGSVVHAAPFTQGPAGRGAHVSPRSVSSPHQKAARFQLPLLWVCARDGVRPMGCGCAPSRPGPRRTFVVLEPLPDPPRGLSLLLSHGHLRVSGC